MRPTPAEVKEYIDSYLRDVLFEVDRHKVEPQMHWVRKRLVVLRQKIVY